MKKANRKMGTKSRARVVAAKKKPASKKAAQPKVINIDPGWAWAAKLPYVQGKRIGNTIFVSGQGPLDPSGRILHPGNMKMQTIATLRNIETILQRAGASLKDVVKITTFITDISRFFEMLEGRAEVFGANLPTSTAVAVAGLAFPEMMVEIEAVAIIP